MDRTIDTIVSHIRRLSKQREEIAKLIREMNRSSPDKIILPISDKFPSKVRICGVDGGFLKKQYHGMGLILRRAVAACFEFENGKLAKTTHFPSKKPVPEPVVLGPEFSDQDFSAAANLHRVEVEIKIAIQAIEALKPDLLVLDGSIVPYPANVPEKSSPAYPIYQRVIQLFQRLYTECEKKNVLLVGAIEDSRGRRYCDIISNMIFPAREAKLPSNLSSRFKKLQPVLSSATDTLLLYNVLKHGERTEHFNYSKSAGDLPVFKDLGEKWKSAINVMYLQAVEYDRPMRLDFLAPKQDKEIATRIATLIWHISKLNRAYAYPSVLIEADACAKLTEHDLFVFRSALSEKLGRDPSLFELRREMRPF